MTEDAFDLIVLGAGSGGLATALRAARHGARVALVEPGELGGTCVNVGCVPKKAMWFAAQMAESLNLAQAYGFDGASGTLDWSAFVERRQAYIGNIHASYRKRLDAMKVSLIPGHGRLQDRQTVQVDERRMHAPHIVIATGARPRRLATPGFDLGIVSDGFFDLRACPRRVAIVGGGYIGVELGGMLRSLGAEVDMIVRGHLMRGFDAGMTRVLGKAMQDQGITIHYHCKVSAASRASQGVMLDCAGTRRGPYDVLLWAVGRVPNSAALGLEELGIRTDDNGHVLTDAFQNTHAAGIYAIGDVTQRVALTPVAIAAGRCLADRLFTDDSEAHLDYENIPTVVFAHPPLAGVGLSEEVARELHGDAVRTYRAEFSPMQWALADWREVCSVMKLVCVGEDERVVGIHAFGPGVEEMMQGFAVALKMGARKRDFGATVAIHPTAAEELVLMG